MRTSIETKTVQAPWSTKLTGTGKIKPSIIAKKAPVKNNGLQQFERLFEASLKSQFRSYQRMQGRGSGAQTERKMDVNPLEEALFGDSR